MKSFTFYFITLFLTCASAFAPVANTRPAFTSLAASNNAPEPISEVMEGKNAAALAAFATAIAPIAAQAAEIDEGVVIGYGAGLVACVVSLAVGFAIGYGTLVKL